MVTHLLFLRTSGQLSETIWSSRLGSARSTKKTIISQGVKNLSSFQNSCSPASSTFNIVSKIVQSYRICLNNTKFHSCLLLNSSCQTLLKHNFIPTHKKPVFFLPKVYYTQCVLNFQSVSVFEQQFCSKMAQENGSNKCTAGEI